MDARHLKRIGFRLQTQAPAYILRARPHSSSANEEHGTNSTNATCFHWPKDDVVSSSVIIQNFSRDMTHIPSEISDLLGAASLELLPCGMGGRRRRVDVRAELLQPMTFYRIERWQRELRDKLRKNVDFENRADLLEMVPQDATVASLPQCSGRVVVADTDSLSLIFKGSTRSVGLQEALLEFDEKIISFQTVAELKAWIMISCFTDERAQQLEQFLSSYKIAYPDDQTCLIWAMLVNYCDAHGRPGGAQDMWVAATALRYGAVLCTSNLKDYDYLPWLKFLTPKNQTLDRHHIKDRCTLTQCLDAGDGFLWKPTEVLVQALVVQNFESRLAAIPSEIYEVFGRNACTHLLPGGKAARKQRTDIHVQLPVGLQVGELQELQDSLRTKLAANDVFSKRANLIELSPERVVVASQPAPMNDLIVVDTSVVFSMFKGEPSTCIEKICGARPRKLIVFQTVADLYNLVWSRRFREERIHKLEQLLADYEVVYPDELTTVLWATLMNYCRAHAYPTGEQNVWIAATALRYGAAVWTKDSHRYKQLFGVRLLVDDAEGVMS